MPSPSTHTYPCTPSLPPSHNTCTPCTCLQSLHPQCPPTAPALALSTRHVRRWCIRCVSCLLTHCSHAAQQGRHLKVLHALELLASSIFAVKLQVMQTKLHHFGVSQRVLNARRRGGENQQFRLDQAPPPPPLANTHTHTPGNGPSLLSLVE